MRDFDLFEFYRFMLVVLLTVYSTLKLILFIWSWQGSAGETRLGSKLAYRYAISLLLGVRVHRFLYEFAVILVLSGILVLSILAHG